MQKPGDDPQLALAAIGRVEGGPAEKRSQVSLLHRSNNVVARVGDIVAKVMNTDDPGGLREYELALYGSKIGAPVLLPVAEPSFVGDYVITWWPYVEAVKREADPGVLSAALRSFHNGMRSTVVPLRSPTEAAGSNLGLALDERATAAMPDEARAAIVPVLERVAGLHIPEHGTVVHGEPHSGNYIVSDRGVVLIDLEGVKRAPVEYDLAFLSAEAVSRYWPDHDPGLLSIFRLIVSAQVATQCWRHVTARPNDDHARWHAEYHSQLLIGVPVEQCTSAGSPARPAPPTRDGQPPRPSTPEQRSR